MRAICQLRQRVPICFLISLASNSSYPHEEPIRNPEFTSYYYPIFLSGTLVGKSLLVAATTPFQQNTGATALVSLDVFALQV